MGIADKIMLDAWRLRESAGKFQHEFFGHVDSSCSTCHNVLTMNTADPLTRKGQHLVVCDVSCDADVG